jgi:pimeloyl-ACP methyl ester carboxylesterase
MSKVVLVHGAWHGASCWDLVVADLDRRAVANTAVQLPHTGLDDDVACARQAILAAGPGSVVVGHSYGGFVISAAAASAPGIARLVYLAAFMADVGDDPATTMAGVASPLLAAIQVTEEGVTVDPGQARQLFYGDSDDATAAAAVARLRPLRLAGATLTVGEPAWKSIPTTYVVCTNDLALPPEAQRAMAANADTVVEWPTDHSPFLTRPAEVAELASSYLG